MGKITISNKPLANESLRINPRKGKIKFEGTILKYRDKDTRQIVIFVPSLDLTSYGATDKKAEEMIDFSLEDFFAWLIKLSPTQIESELKALGWKHVKYKNKEYSQTYVDEDGTIQNFNAVADKVERLTIMA